MPMQALKCALDRTAVRRLGSHPIGCAVQSRWLAVAYRVADRAAVIPSWESWRRSCGSYSPSVTGIVPKESHAHDLLRPLLNSGEGVSPSSPPHLLSSKRLLLPSKPPRAQSTASLAAARIRARRPAAGRRRRTRTCRRIAARRRHSPARFPLFPSCALVLWIYQFFLLFSLCSSSCSSSVLPLFFLSFP